MNQDEKLCLAFAATIAFWLVMLWVIIGPTLAHAEDYVRLDVCKPELVAKMWGNPVDYVLVSKGRPILIHQSKHKGCSRLVFGANASVEVLGEIHTIKNLIGD